MTLADLLEAMRLWHLGYLSAAELDATYVTWKEAQR